MNDQEKRNELFFTYRKELLERELSNSVNLDKSILSLSTAGLGFSLAFIKDVVPLTGGSLLWLLIISWYLFASAIISTIISFITSQLAIKKQIDYAKQYYCHREEEYSQKKNSLTIVTERLNCLSCIFFIFAILFTIIFISININGGSKMSNEKNVQQTPLKKGATIPKMPQVPINNTPNKIINPNTPQPNPNQGNTNPGTGGGLKK